LTVYFFDTSALVKRYVTEAGSNWVRAAANRGSGNVVFIAQITPVEVVSAFARRERDGSIATRTSKAMHLLLNRHVTREYEVIGLSNAVVRQAQTLLGQYILRGFDAIQLASALEIQTRLAAANRPPLVFVCSDTRLLQAATQSGLQTVIPT
jgi:predicted nucleic acid-binding protein